MLESKFLLNKPLFRECLEALGVSMLPEQEAEKISELFIHMYPITEWGKIDWDKIDKKIDIGYEPQNIVPALEKLLQGRVDKTVYIEWSTGGLPVIKADLDKVIEFFDDVTCVAFEKFIFNPTVGYIIEVLPSYKMSVGLVPITKK
jgi:hypothetical protein